MPTATFLGLRATNDFTVEGQRPKNWREGILKLYPNGKAPLTALLALTKNESTDDPEFNWFTRIFAEQNAELKGVFTTSGLATEASGAVPTNTLLYPAMEEAYAKYFKAGHVVLLRSEEHPDQDAAGLVVQVSLAGADSYLQIRMLQSTVAFDDPDPKAWKRLLVIGSAHAEGAQIPDSIQYDPTQWSNYTQIFRNSLELTRTAMKTRLRTGDSYKQTKADTLEMHSVEMEKAFLFGVPSNNVGANGKPLRTTMGLIHAIRTGGGVVDNFTGTETDWLDDGTDWFEEQLMQCFNYGSTDKLAFVGNKALLGLNRLARKWGRWTYTPTTKAFGISVNEYVTPFGTITVKTHPLFSQEPTNQGSMLIFEPKNLRYRYITDTDFFKDDQQHGAHRYDGLKEEFLTEAGLEFHHPKSCAWLNGLGGK